MDRPCFYRVSFWIFFFFFLPRKNRTDFSFFFVFQLNKSWWSKGEVILLLFFLEITIFMRWKGDRKSFHVRWKLKLESRYKREDEIQVHYRDRYVVVRVMRRKGTAEDTVKNTDCRTRVEKPYATDIHIYIVYRRKIIFQQRVKAWKSEGNVCNILLANHHRQRDSYVFLFNPVEWLL